MLLYNSAVSGNCYKVRLLLAQLGIELRAVDLSVVDRSNRTELLGDLNPGCACRRSCSTTAGRSASRTRSSGTSATGRRTCPTTLRASPGAPVDVLRAVQPRALSRRRPLLARVLGDAGGIPDQVPAKMKGGYAALDAMERHLEGGASSSASAIRSPTSRSTRTRTSRTRASSTSSRIRRSARGSIASPRSRGTFDRRLSTRVAPMAVRVRFAPSPTGSLHVGNALTAVANRRFADEREGVARPPDRRHRCVAHGRGRRGRDPRGSRLARALVRRGPAAPERARRRCMPLPRERAARSGRRARRRRLRAPRGGGRRSLRADGTATYQLASVVDDLELGITHVIRGSDHRPNLDVQQRIARALGGELPEVIHHGLVLGEDGKKLSKRHGHSSIADLRDDGFPAAAVRAYLDELGLPEHDVQLDLPRLRRLAIDAIAAMTRRELAAAASAPVEVAPVLRGARSLVEAREYAHLVLEPLPSSSAPKPARRSSASWSCARGAGARSTRQAPRARARAQGRRRGPASAPPCAHREPREARARGGPRRGPAREALERARARSATARGYDRRMRVYDTLTRIARRAAAEPPAADRDVRLRPDGLPARAHRQRASVRRLLLARELAARARLRGHVRPQRHDVNDKIYDAAPGRSAELARDATRWYLEDTGDLGLGMPDEHAARDRDDPRDRRADRGAGRRAASPTRSRATSTSASRASPTTARSRASGPTRSRSRSRTR